MASQYLTTPDFLAYLAKQKGSRMQRLQGLCDMLADDKRPKCVRSSLPRVCSRERGVFRAHVAYTTCRARNFADCVRFARLQFQEWYNIAIKNLLHQHPLDEVRAQACWWPVLKLQ